MYLHEDFIACIKGRFAYAHPGNVCQLLESFNKLAGAGAEVFMSTDWSQLREVIEVKYKGKREYIYITDITYSDFLCVELTKQLSTVRDNLGILVN